MRKINSIIALIITFLLFDHLVFGSLYLFGIGQGIIRPLAYGLVILIIIHAIISIVLSVRSMKNSYKTKTFYFKENHEYYLRRISGLAIIVFACLHVYGMGRDGNGPPRVAFMGTFGKLSTSFLLISVLLHLYFNVKAILIALGIRHSERLEKIIKAILLLLCAFALAANIYRLSH